MSLVSIISQLQSIQPYRRNATPESIALDLTKTKDSLLNMARLLQSSGRSQGNQYFPNESLSSKNSNKLTKDVRRASGEVDKLSSDQKRFKAFIQQTIKNVDKQMVSVNSMTKRNQNLIKSLQSEIGLGRAQRMMNYSFGTSAAQIPSYGRNIKGQLNRLSQQISVLNSNQQRMIQEAEKKGEGERGSSAAITRQRIARAISKERSSISSTQLPGFAEAGTKEGDLQRQAFFAGLSMFMSTNASGKSLLDKLKSIFGGEPQEEDLIEKIKAIKGGTPYKVEDGKVQIKTGTGEPKEIKEIRDQLASLEQKMSGESDTQKKSDLGKQIEKLKKDKLDKLKSSGFITQEVVDAGLATTKDITHYKLIRSPGAEPEYIEKSIVEKYPEIYEVDTKGSLTLKKDWEKSIVPDKIEQIGLPPASKGKAATIAEIRNDTAFLEEVRRVSDSLGIDAADLLAIMSIETGKTFDPAIQNPDRFEQTTATINGKEVMIPAGYATGLIQFIPQTAYSLGTTTEALKRMTRVEQMKYVEKYFEMVKLPRGASKGQIYAYVFQPGRAAKGESIFAVKGDPKTGYIYEANPGLDINGDGQITIEDLQLHVKGATPIAEQILGSEPTASIAPTTTGPTVESPQPDMAATAEQLVAKAEIEQNKDVTTTAHGTALAAYQVAAENKQGLVKLAKDVNNIREIVRITSDTFKVENSSIGRIWNS